jgi:branched-subunit amino acid transport protein AzlD
MPSSPSPSSLCVITIVVIIVCDHHRHRHLTPSFVRAQSQANPYVSDFDNILEQSVLCMLIIVLYAELALAPAVIGADPASVPMNLVVTVVAVGVVVTRWASLGRVCH